MLPLYGWKAIIIQFHAGSKQHVHDVHAGNLLKSLLPFPQTPLAELKLLPKLKWRGGKDLLIKMSGYPSVVVFKDKVYIGGGISSGVNQRTVVVYDPKQDSCHTLPPYTYRYFSMAVINDQLVLIGGCEVKSYKKQE